MQIPDYIVKAVYAHYRRIAARSKADPGDHRTADALRLAKEDLRRLGKYVNVKKGGNDTDKLSPLA